MRRALAILAAGLVAAFGLAASGQARETGLRGEVGPGFKIEVERGNTDVKRIRHGTYRMLIEDKSSNHNFHLIGPGINKKTTVAFKGKQRWTVRLKKGRYAVELRAVDAMGNRAPAATKSVRLK